METKTQDILENNDSQKSEVDFEEAMKKGYDDAKAGRSKPAADVFAELRKLI